MTESPDIRQLELEVQGLLLKHSRPDAVADELLKKYSEVELNIHELKFLGTFFIHCGFYSVLNDFILGHLKRDRKIPWAHLTESVFLMADVPNSIKVAIWEGAKAQGLERELTRTHFLDATIPELPELRRQRQAGYNSLLEEKKQELLQKLQILHSQGLVDAEEKILLQLIQMFPDDVEPQQHLRRFKEQKAVHFLSKKHDIKPRHIPIEIYQKKDDEELALLHLIEEQMHELVAENIGPSQLAQDFAMAHFMWENFEASLSLLSTGESTEVSQWFELEILLVLRRFVDIFSKLKSLEITASRDPEKTFALIYIRAQALWGLGEKFSAIEMMESLVTTRPHFRSAASLLSRWKGELG